MDARSLKSQDKLRLLLDEEATRAGAKIKVIGVGGGGGNAVNRMVRSGFGSVEFIVANTDEQALAANAAPTKIQIGRQLTKGLGAGANPEVGRQAAMEDRDRIIELIEGCDMLFITAGMGGGTGTGAAPVVAQVARELGILTVAEMGMTELSRHVDSLITIPNQKLLQVLGGQTTLLEAFKRANEVLQGAVQGIAELITRPGLINVDFADVRTVMSETGLAMMGSGIGTGEHRARVAAEMAVSSPLLEDINLAGAHGILVNVTAGLDLSIGEFEEVGNTVKQFAAEDATVVVGTVIEPEMQGELRVTVVATGLNRAQAKVAAPAQAPAVAPTNARRPTDVKLVAQRRPAPDYSHLDRPAIHRQPQRAVGDGLRANLGTEDVLDIPAFLRRQAD